MLTTTLNEILKHNPCGQNSKGHSGISKLLKHLNKTEVDDKPISFIEIVESNGIHDAIWCLRVLPEYDLKVMEFKLKCARRVDHLDKSGSAKRCLDVVSRFIAGNATESELRVAADAAYAASAAAAYAAAAAAAAAVAAAAAAADAYAAAVAAYAAAVAADAAADADAAVADAAVAEREYQTEIFKEIFG